MDVGGISGTRIMTVSGQRSDQIRVQKNEITDTSKRLLIVQNFSENCNVTININFQK